ncbi:PPOX class F420-dependent oxidoreductase [Solihabitans fulvus]|uniref:PPOX class F420-dependent oxidoreductase n=1 Tax=Solihabitans fulvus TaxID=1892852 RepID=A0A5B2WT82_9PSEU|nr:PPOX class F420-dependent oxidoreductase [Solihabitans fulvus]KAA2254040.1 PPOX class F420-dependent oxidoreductase [Solihabitans fulvus]
MTVQLNDAVRALLDGRNFAVLATVNADGSPQTSAMWIGRDGDDLVFSTVAGRLKDRNIRRTPQVSVTILEDGNPYNYVEVRGLAKIEESGGVELNDKLSWKYDGKPFEQDAEGAVRVVVRVSPQRLTGYAAH